MAVCWIVSTSLVRAVLIALMLLRMLAALVSMFMVWYSVIVPVARRYALRREGRIVIRSSRFSGEKHRSLPSGPVAGFVAFRVALALSELAVMLRSPQVHHARRPGELAKAALGAGTFEIGVAVHSGASIGTVRKRKHTD